MNTENEGPAATPAPLYVRDSGDGGDGGAIAPASRLRPPSSLMALVAEVGTWRICEVMRMPGVKPIKA